MTPHAVCIPYPAQGHIGPMLKLAKILHVNGFHITFINTDFNHNRLLRTQGPDSVKGLVDFWFKSIPDGLPPPPNPDATQDIPSLCDSIQNNCLAPFLNLINNLNASTDSPNVTCIVSDVVMSFTLGVAEKLQIPELVLFTASACGFMSYLHFAELVARGYVPFKDESWFTNGYLETEIDWVPGMKGIRLKDFPSFIRTMDPKDIMLNYNITELRNASKAKGVIFNTYDDLEEQVLEVIRSKFNQVYTIGPLHLLEKEFPESKLNSLGSTSSLWKENDDCIKWLDQMDEKSVIYINFGSIAVVSVEQLGEFARGIANSKHNFLWIIRPDMVADESDWLSEEFVAETKERGMMTGWCPQEKVLAHPSIGGFLTHCGWNSTLESVTSGVPMICWPFFAEQQMNCRYACTKWDVGMEIESDVIRREKVEELVRELMEGEKGKEMRVKGLEWKEKAHMAAKPGGSSYMNLERLIKDSFY